MIAPSTLRPTSCASSRYRQDNRRALRSSPRSEVGQPLAVGSGHIHLPHCCVAIRHPNHSASRGPSGPSRCPGAPTVLRKSSTTCPETIRPSVGFPPNPDSGPSEGLNAGPVISRGSRGNFKRLLFLPNLRQCLPGGVWRQTPLVPRSAEPVIEHYQVCTRGWGIKRGNIVPAS